MKHSAAEEGQMRGKEPAAPSSEIKTPGAGCPSFVRGDGSPSAGKEKQKEVLTSILPPRPHSATERRTLAGVNSMEHASMVIKSLRSMSHSQKSYHRTACSDATVISSLREFDQVVMQQSLDLQKARSIHEAIVAPPPGSRREAGSTTAWGDTSASTARGSQKPDAGESNRSRSGNSRIKSTIPPAKSAAQKKTVEIHSGSRRADCDSDSDDFLGGDDDDDDDMSALMEGFVAPRATTDVAPTSMNYDSDDDGMGDPPTFEPQEPQKQQHAKPRRAKVSKGTQRTQSAGTMGKSDDLVGGASEVPIQSSGSRLRDTGGSSMRDTGSNSKRDAGSGSRSNAGGGGAGGADKKHHVLITPGQRIRVKPAGRSKNKN